MNKDKHRLDYLEEAGLVQSGIYSNDNSVQDDDIIKLNKLLVACSWRTLKKEKVILFYPITSLLINILFLAVLYFLNGVPAFYMLIVLTYFMISFNTIFFNTALIGALKKGIEGNVPEFSDGIKEAKGRLLSIFEWTFYVTTIGFFLSLLRGNKFLKLFSYAADITWALATYFVIPFIVFEGKGTDAAISESKSLIKKNWGKCISGEVSIYISFSLIGFMLFLIILIAFLTGYRETALVVLIIGVFIFLVMGILNTAVRAIFNTNLFLYAQGKKDINYFSQQLQNNHV